MGRWDLTPAAVAARQGRALGIVFVGDRRPIEGVNRRSMECTPPLNLFGCHRLAGRDIDSFAEGVESRWSWEAGLLALGFDDSPRGVEDTATWLRFFTWLDRYPTAVRNQSAFLR